MIEQEDTEEETHEESQELDADERIARERMQLDEEINKISLIDQDADEDTEGIQNSGNALNSSSQNTTTDTRKRSGDKQKKKQGKLSNSSSSSSSSSQAQNRVNKKQFRQTSSLLSDNFISQPNPLLSFLFLGAPLGIQFPRLSAPLSLLPQELEASMRYSPRLLTPSPAVSVAALHRANPVTVCSFSERFDLGLFLPTTPSLTTFLSQMASNFINMASLTELPTHTQDDTQTGRKHRAYSYDNYLSPVVLTEAASQLLAYLLPPPLRRCVVAMIDVMLHEQKLQTDSLSTLGDNKEEDDDLDMDPSALVDHFLELEDKKDGKKEEKDITPHSNETVDEDVVLKKTKLSL